MNDSVFPKMIKACKKLTVYTPPPDPSNFVLDENRPHDQPEEKQDIDPNRRTLAALDSSLRFARRLENFLSRIIRILAQGRWPQEAEQIRSQLAALEKELDQLSPLTVQYDAGNEEARSSQPLSPSLEENKKSLERIYRLDVNRDVVLRSFRIAADPAIRALAVFTDGLVNSRTLNESILQPLLSLTADPRFAEYRQETLSGEDLLSFLSQRIMPNGQIQRGDTFGAVEQAINSGDTALLFDGVGQALLLNAKGWEHRGVERPLAEQSIAGSQAALSENLRVNTGLIRTMLRSSDLVTEMIKIGVRSQLQCAVMYIQSIANPFLVAEIRRRLQGIRIDYVSDSGALLQLIEDHPLVIYPQSLSTERPDRVAAHLVEGRVAILLEGNPYAHIVPVSFFTFFHSAEDFSFKPGISNFMRILRYFGALISTVLPALYLAIVYYHQEAAPTQLLLAVAGSRENVPFPAWFEILVMEASFELIREAGIRIPGVLGATIGIVGAIILGQAAVSAHLVSPIIVVIIAITGLASFTIPEYRMSSAMRITRFSLLIAAIFMGLVGLATFLLWLMVLFCGMKSFGVPYMSPIAPKAAAGSDLILRGAVDDREKRPDDLNTRDSSRQPDDSLLWRKQPPAGDE